MDTGGTEDPDPEETTQLRRRRTVFPNADRIAAIATLLLSPRGHSRRESRGLLLYCVARMQRPPRTKQIGR